MLFDVTIQRVEYREHVFRVEAADGLGAEDAAMSDSEFHDFHDDPVAYARELPTRIVPAREEAP